MPVTYSLTLQYRSAQDAWSNVVIEPVEDSNLTSNEPSVKWSTLDQAFAEGTSHQSSTTTHGDTSETKSPIERTIKAHQKNETISSLTKRVPNLAIDIDRVESNPRSEKSMHRNNHGHSEVERLEPFLRNAPEGWTAVWNGE